jgi:Ser/Thr protein kinase RdoA (MazF antagonist)
MAEPDGNPDQRGLADPPMSVWTELGLTPEAEVHGGFQSKVFLATHRGDRLIVKLTEAGHADAALRERVEATRQLAEINPAVVGPIVLESEPVSAVGGWHAVCYRYIEGTHPDTGDRGDVETMAETLAVLHDSLARLTNINLPPVAALDEVPRAALSSGQLIHGDYAPANLIATSSGLAIIDFDGCGQGSVEFELGNTLYMVLFDAWRSGRRDHYDRFRSWFLDAYREAASLEVEDALVDEAIRVRASALRRWLATPTEAPIGIRTASPAWRRQLHPFVAEVLS